MLISVWQDTEKFGGFNKKENYDYAVYSIVDPEVVKALDGDLDGLDASLVECEDAVDAIELRRLGYRNVRVV